MKRDMYKNCCENEFGYIIRNIESSKYAMAFGNIGLHLDYEGLKKLNRHIKELLYEKPKDSCKYKRQAVINSSSEDMVILLSIVELEKLNELLEQTIVLEGFRKILNE